MFLRFGCFFSAFLLFGAAVRVQAQSAANFVALPPCRVVDTRDASRGALGAPALHASAARDFPILQSSCGLPATAVAYALNVTVVPHGALPYLTVWPAGQEQPNASTLNSFSGSVVANAAIVSSGANGAVSLFAAGETDVILDVNGYFTAAGLTNNQFSQTIAQTNQQITQVNQQVAQQLSQVSQQAAQVSQQAAQVSQMVSQVNQQSSLLSANNGVLRLGTPGVQTKTYIAGIAGTGVDIGDMVLVDQHGQLGTIQSSRRYKENIRLIGETSDKLLALRPVAFEYKRAAADGTKPVQYGLIAEEVEQVYPELVVRNQNGEVETVQYQKLPPLLLNELQKQHRIIEEQRTELESQREQLRRVEERLAALEREESRR